MEITLIKSPGNLEEKVQMPWEKLSEKAAHILIAELYRADCITFRQARHLLNSPSWEKAAGILEHYGCELYYDRDDFEDDLRSLGIDNRIFSVVPMGLGCQFRSVSRQ